MGGLPIASSSSLRESADPPLWRMGFDVGTLAGGRKKTVFRQRPLLSSFPDPIDRKSFDSSHQRQPATGGCQLCVCT
jgi:hypothetical protein